MAQTVSIILFDEDRKALEVIAADRSRPLKHIQRAKIVLHSAGRLPVLEVARRASVSGLAVWRSGGLAVAIALCRRGRRRSAARQDTQAGTRAALAKKTQLVGAGFFLLEFFESFELTKKIIVNAVGLRLDDLFTFSGELKVTTPGGLDKARFRGIKFCPMHAIGEKALHAGR